VRPEPPFDRFTRLSYCISFSVLGIGFVLKKVHEDEHGLFSFRTVDPRVDCRLGVFFRQTLGAQGSDREWARAGRSTEFHFALFNWIGAVPAMLFVGIFMMPFYLRVAGPRSVPEYLKLRL